MKITFSIVNWAKTWHADVEGEIVDVAPHLAHLMTFAIHDDGYGRWQFSNVETGYRVGYARKTKKLAIKAARTLLAGKTDADARRAYRKCGYRP